MAGMHHALMLVSRGVAGIVAAVAFYFAFFLYEDEEGIWQNRIENLWVSVYDRARITRNTATALFNKLAQSYLGFINRIFGSHLFSTRAAANSVSFSMAGLAFGMAVKYLVVDLTSEIHINHIPEVIFEIILGILILAMAIGQLWLPIKCSRLSNTPVVRLRLMFHSWIALSTASRSALTSEGEEIKTLNTLTTAGDSLLESISFNHLAPSDENIIGIDQPFGILQRFALDQPTRVQPVHGLKEGAMLQPRYYLRGQLMKVNLLRVDFTKGPQYGLFC